MNVARVFTTLLIALLLMFGVLQLLGIQPGEDNNRWLLYLFVAAWPLLTFATLASSLLMLKKNKVEPSVIIVLSLAALAGFAVWSRVYAGLW